jgi:hypothetical protein
LQIAFGSGDVLLTGSEDSSLVLSDVPKPALVHAALSELVESTHRPADFDDPTTYTTG